MFFIGKRIAAPSPSPFNFPSSPFAPHENLKPGCHKARHVPIPRSINIFDQLQLQAQQKQINKKKKKGKKMSDTKRKRKDKNKDKKEEGSKKHKVDESDQSDIDMGSDAPNDQSPSAGKSNSHLLVN